MRARELTGLALDWAVAKCEGITEIGAPAGRSYEAEFLLMHDSGDMNFSTDPAQSWPIIDREKIDIEWEGDEWIAGKAVSWSTGPTSLIAAMRCYVACTLGEDVEVPEELV